MFLTFEKELYAIRGNAMISSYAFNLVQLYMKNLSVFLLLGNLFSRLYLKKEREAAIECLKEQNAHRCVFFIDWLLRGIARARGLTRRYLRLRTYADISMHPVPERAPSLVAWGLFAL